MLHVERETNYWEVSTCVCDAIIDSSRRFGHEMACPRHSATMSSFPRGYYLRETERGTVGRARGHHPLIHQQAEKKAGGGFEILNVRGGRLSS